MNGAPKSTPIGPQLEKLEVRIGLSEEEFERVIRARLPELAECIAFGHWTDKGLFKVTTSEKQDDRVQVVIDRNPLFGDRDLGEEQAPFKAEVEGVLSETGCVRQLVEHWPWPREQIEAASRLRGERAPLAKFLYRFRPTAAEREAARRENQASLDLFCNTRVVGDLGQHFVAVEGQMKGALRSTLDSVFRAVAFAAPKDRATIVAGSVREVAEQYDLPSRCTATRGLIPLNTSEYLEEAGRPTMSCADRVKQMKAIASTPLGFAAPRLTSDRAQPIAEAGELFTLEHDLFPDEAELSTRAAAAARAQNRKRPIAYVFINDPSSSERVASLVGFATQVGAKFELRLVVWRASAKTPSYASTAWPQVVKLLREQRPSKEPRIETVPELLHQWEREQETYCPRLVSARKETEPPPLLERLVATVAERLEGCGCPQPYTELTWARLAVLLDDQVDHAGWVPLALTEDPRAPEAVLPRGADLQRLVDALRDKPVRVVQPGWY